MSDNPKKLSDTARALLTAAAMHHDHLIRPPQLPIAAAQQVVKSLLNSGLAEEVPASIEAVEYTWRTADGGVVVLRATALGLGRIREAESTTPAPVAIRTVPDAAVAVTGAREPSRCGVTASAPSSGQRPTSSQRPAQAAQAALRGDTTVPPPPICGAGAVEPALAPPRRVGRLAGVHHAAQALLDVWDRFAEVSEDATVAMNGPITGLRVALTVAASAAVEPSSPPKHTKQAQVLAMLARDEGASGPQIAEATGWAPHTVRGFLAGLAKKGMVVDVLERVRQVGSNKQGTKGGYTVYCLGSQGQQ